MATPDRTPRRTIWVNDNAGGHYVCTGCWQIQPAPPSMETNHADWCDEREEILAQLAAAEAQAPGGAGGE